MQSCPRDLYHAHDLIENFQLSDHLNRMNICGACVSNEEYGQRHAVRVLVSFQTLWKPQHFFHAQHILQVLLYLSLATGGVPILVQQTLLRGQ